MNKAVFLSFFSISILIALTRCNSHDESISNADRELLDSLRNICLVNRPSSMLKDKAFDLRKEAERQNDNLYLAHAYQEYQFYYIMSPLVENVGDSIHFYTEKAKYYYAKSNDQEEILRIDMRFIRWKLIFESYIFFVDIFDLITQSEQFPASDISPRVYSILGWAYMGSSSFTEAHNSFLKELEAIKELDPLKNKTYNISDLCIVVFNELTHAASSMDNYSLAISYCDSMQHYMDKRKMEIDYSALQATLDLNRLELYTLNGETEKAALIAEEILPEIPNLEPLQQSSAYMAFAFYYSYKGDYDKALEIVELYESLYLEDQTLSSSDLYKKRKTVILAAKNRFEEAYNLRSELFSDRKLVSRSNSTRQLSEMYTLYNVNKFERISIENKTKATDSKILAVVLFLVSVSFIVIIVVVKKNVDKLKKKNRQIFIQIQSLDKYRSLLNNLKQGETENKSSEENTLFAKIEQYMQSTHCYTDANITREDLALHIGTNRQYLGQAIQEGIGMTFNEYINHYRLESARIQLIQNVDLSIENIYMSVGFVHKSTFYRLFKEKYNLTPKEVRDFAIR